MIIVRLRDRVTLQAPCLKGDKVHVGTTGTVAAILRKLPGRIKVAWDCGGISTLLVGLDDFTVKSNRVECPSCGTDDPFHLPADAATGIVTCNCGHEFDPDNHR